MMILNFTGFSFSRVLARLMLESRDPDHQDPSASARVEGQVTGDIWRHVESSRHPCRSLPPTNKWPNRHAEGSFAAGQSAQGKRTKKISHLTSGNMTEHFITVDPADRPLLTWRFHCVIFPSREPTRRLSSAACTAIQKMGRNKTDDWNYQTFIGQIRQIPTFDVWTTIHHHVWWVQTHFSVAEPPPRSPIQSQKGGHCPCQTSIMQLIPSWTGHRKSKMGLPKCPKSSEIQCWSFLAIWGYIYVYTPCSNAAIVPNLDRGIKCG